ncbi:MAG: DUF4105 domain-containing protein [Spirochaetaceae bacterium]|jgi:hypothetical protein|nr:DUF4105 domain-containing protein [Spirochaetaceae bacterium]
MLCPDLAAQEETPGEYLTIKVVEIGPGDDFFSWWGHLVIMVDNELTGKSLCYDFGVFSFDDPHLIRNFLKGDLNYKILVSAAQDDLEWYIKNNCTITLYTLNLDNSQKEQTAAALNRNVLPENRNYLYKIFTDNCVTKTIVIIDRALDGKFIEKYKNEKGRFTLREHAGRYLYRSVVLYVVLNFIMGEETDRPVSRYEEMYLPSEFAAALVDFAYADVNGTIRPLVSGIEKINVSIGRPAVLPGPPHGSLYAFLAGMTGAVVFMLLGMFGKKNRGAGIVLYVTQSLMALCWAVMGTVLFYAMFFSHHTYTYNNLNIIYANPLLFAGVPLGILCAVTKHERKRAFYSRILKALWTYVLIGSLGTVALRITGLNHTNNTLTLLLIVPPALVVSYVGDWAYILGTRLSATRPVRKAGG